MMIEDLESFWDEFLVFVEARSVIPVIGPELAVVEYESVRQPYQRLLAQQLAARLKLTDLSPSPDLREVIGAWLARPGAKRQAIYRELGDLAAKLPVEIPESLLQLARIRDLNLFTSFCPNDLLTRALNQERYGGQAQTLELAFTPSDSADLPSGPVEGSLVYYLFGRSSVLPKYVATEDDMLEWVAALQVPEKRPERLFDELGDNHLLFLGCDFPDWLGRFILRTTKNHKLSASRDFGEYLIDARAGTSDPFVVFLQSFSLGTQVLPYDPISFVSEFERRWRERQGASATQRPAEPGPMSATMPPDSVFISYASEDRPAAFKLAADLQAAGLPVWLDRQQLDWGVDYTARIQLAIQQCALFLPILSRTAEQRVGFFRKEWRWAAERNGEFTGADVKFLFPLVIDDTPVFTSQNIPADFKATHIEAAPAGQTSAQQQSTIVAAYRNMRAKLERQA